MTSLVLDEHTEKTTIAEMLASVSGSVLEIKDSAGNLLATLHLETQARLAELAVRKAEAELDELHRRCESDRSTDVTTEQLLERARKAAAE